MNWADERYVRLYTRDTATWKRWNWQTRAVLGLLLRKVDRSGVLDTGRVDKVANFALLVEVPIEVASAAVAELLASGTMVEADGGYCLPTFIEAQETRQTDAARQRASRETRRALTLQSSEAACHQPSPAVTSGHQLSPPVTPAVPSRAVPSQPKTAPKSKSGGTTKIPAGEHQATIDALTEAYATATGAKYPFTGRDAVSVGRMLKATTRDAIEAAWARALAHRGWPTVRTLHELEKNLAHFVGAAPPVATKGPIQPAMNFTNSVSEGF